MQQICKNITWDISKIVAQEVMRERSYYDTELVAKIEKEVSEKLPDFLGDLVADLYFVLPKQA
jgi:hypothetical protein